MGADPITLINFRRSLTPLMECLTSDVKDYLTRPLCPFFNGAEYWMHSRWYPWVRRGRALLRLFKNVACGERCCARCDEGVCGSRKRSLTFPLDMRCSLERLSKFIMYGNCLLSMSTTLGWSCHGGAVRVFLLRYTRVLLAEMHGPLPAEIHAPLSFYALVIGVLLRWPSDSVFFGRLLLSTEVYGDVHKIRFLFDRSRPRCYKS